VERHRFPLDGFKKFFSNRINGRLTEPRQVIDGSVNGPTAVWATARRTSLPKCWNPQLWLA